ncbi:sorting nexin-41 [[Candida] anglica]|uniref:Sorting nexin-41 n=1 Tax=[Candida] anglica TaxID=148631 RepID=A0ABP0EQ85_9ASCO
MSEEPDTNSVFDEVEEDNNPFSHTQGLASLINDGKAVDIVDDTNEDGTSTTRVSSLQGPEESVLLYKSTAPSQSLTSNQNVGATQPDQAVDGGEGSNVVVSGDFDFNRIQLNHETRVTRLLKPHTKVRIQITEAGNSNEGVSNSSKKYIVYTIRLINVDDPSEDIQTRRRYSDFESLRDILTKIFPLVIVPPIPPKNYFNLNVLNGLVASNISVASVTSGGGTGTGGGHMNGAGDGPVGESNTDAGGSGGAAGAGAGVNAGVGEPAENKGPSNGGTKDNIINNSIGLPNNNYSYINSNHLNKHKLVEHRKRLLSNFLNNCLEIPKIRNLEFFSKFLDPNANWTDEIVLITSQLPKSVYQSNPENGLQTDGIYTNLPLPVSSHSLPRALLRPLQENKKRFNRRRDQILGTDTPATESNHTTTANNNSVDNTEAVVADGSDQDIINTTLLDSTNNRIMENFIGLANDYTELGSIFNSFSLILSDSPDIRGKPLMDEEIKLNIIFDKVGQVFDRSYITLNSLIGDLETKFSEPLGEAVRYSSTLQSIRKFKDRKLRQSVLLERELEDKKREYNELSRFEAESERVESAYGQGGGTVRNAKYDLKADPTPISKSKYKLFPSMNSLKKITQYVSDIIDQNPEETRKQKLVALKNKIDILEVCQVRMAEDISYIADELNNNFKSFQKRQLKMIYDILLRYNGFLIDWAKKNVEIWEDIREEIQKL